MLLLKEYLAKRNNMAFKLKKSSDALFHKSALKNTGPAITPTVEDGVIPSDMTTGRSGHLDEVVIGVKPKKTRAEHRLAKTQVKGEEATEKGNYAKANRLQRRKQRLAKKVARQEGKEKKRYARKDKKFYRDREENA